MMRKIIFLVLLITCLVVPVMGESGTLYFNYTEQAGYTTTIANSGSITSTSNIGMGGRIHFDTIENYNSVTSIVAGVTGLNVLKYNEDYSRTSGETTFTSTVGNGEYYWYRNIINGTSTKAIVVIKFDSWDIGSLTGSQTITLSLSDSTEILEANSCYMGATSTDLSKVFFYSDSSRSDLTYIQDVEVYQEVDFRQYIDYDTNAEDRLIDLDYYRNGETNTIVITDQTDEIRYSDASSNLDRNIAINDVEYITVTISNPVAPDTPFNSIIYITNVSETPTPEEPETPTPEEPETEATKFKGYIYDAQTGNLIGGSVLNVRENYTNDDPYLLNVTNKDGVSEYTFEWADDVDWLNFTASAIGYNPSTEYFNHSVTTAPPGSTVDMSFHLVSDGSLGTGAYALSFLVYQSVSSESALVVKSSDATVICDGEQHLTGLSGGTWFNVTAGDHTYIISKNGFETLQGTVSIDSNYLKTVTLELGPDTPTVDDPTGNETGEVGDETMHEAVAEAYAQFGAFVPEAVMIACVLFLLSMFKKF